MDADELRSLQAPLKERYREDTDAALIVLKASGATVDDASEIACSVDGAGKARCGRVPDRSETCTPRGPARAVHASMLRRHAAPGARSRLRRFGDAQGSRGHALSIDIQGATRSGVRAGWRLCLKPGRALFGRAWDPGAGNHRGRPRWHPSVSARSPYRLESLRELAQRRRAGIDLDRSPARSIPARRWSTGLHPSGGGTGLQACSGDMLLQALVACAGVTLRAVATALSITFKPQRRRRSRVQRSR